MAATAQDSHAPLRQEGKKDEDREEDLDYSPFFGIEKGAVLQEARVFHDPQVDPRRAQQVITKLLYLLSQGESFSKKEASEVFFGVTKLFQHKDHNLRRMVYLCIKDICPGADEVIIVTSSLMKDMNSKVDLYRSNGIRVLCQIIDPGLLQQIERYLKQAIVDKSPVVASSVLCCAFNLMRASSDVVKRWSSEITNAVQSPHQMVQYHAVSLLHAIKATDRLAISKLVSQLTRDTRSSAVKSPLAQCLLIRYVTQVLSESRASGAVGSRPFYDFLESCLRHKSEMVIFEAARAIAGLRDVTSRELSPAITVLQLFLSSAKPTLRFSAARALSKVAMTHPMAVTNCNIDMERLISDPNRSIATLAITTLLKTGNEGSVDRLLKQIGNFMSDIADDFKIVVVEAIRSLCLKFPQKHRALMNFLSNVLREEGGFEYKKAIVEAVLALIRDIPDAKEAGLTHLSEFIEDCEFTFLSTQILHLLGQEGPRTAHPAKYIRYIYNRIILENATVRAAAVSALAQFGARCESLRPRVVVLLNRALNDNDDEVRDRAALYLQELAGVAGGPDAITASFNVPMVNLEKALAEYLAAPDTDVAFDLDAVPRAVEAPLVPANAGKGGAALPSAPKASASEEYSAALHERPEFAPLGRLFRTSEPVELTEEGTEYSVTAVKHIFDSHVVLHYACTNTVAEQVLENVSVMVDLADAEEFEEEEAHPMKLMPYDGVGHTFVVLAREELAASTGKVMNILKFTVREVVDGEPEEGGYEDEYPLEDLEITAADYLKPTTVGNFKKAWDEYGEETELADDYGLGERDSLEEAVEAVAGILGMGTCEGTEVVAPNARSHSMLLSATFVGGTPVLVRLAFGIDADKNVAMKLVARSSLPEVCEAIHQIIQEA